jgi:UMF1 family MFS transporter
MRFIMADAALDQRTYQRRIRAWTLYDWANSAFATTILAAVLPIYYSQVAGATLPSEATATAYWSVGLSVSLFITAIISPILGTISDIMRGKKRFLAIFTGVGILATGMLVLVDRGDWLLASLVFVVGRIGFNGAYTFYDALLPHVARPEDQDSVSARGYAMGYLGGGLLLAVNAAMIFLLPGTWGPRLSFLSVAIWWAVFSIPVFRLVPEPPAATETLKPGETVIGASFIRLGQTIRDIRHYRELFKYLLAFLIYNDAIGTIIGVAAIYGAELGFGSTDLILALLLVQFVGIPFSLIFGRLPSQQEQRRPLFLAFIVFNLIALPIVGIAASQLLPLSVTGAEPASYETIENGFVLGEGEYPAVLNGATVALDFNGQSVEVFYPTGPNLGIWTLMLDGEGVLDESGQQLVINPFSEFERSGNSLTVEADAPGAHHLVIVPTGTSDPRSSGSAVTLEKFVVLPPARQSSLPLIVGLIVAVQIIGAVFALAVGRRGFSRLAATMDTRRSILLSLAVYTVIAIWGYFINSTVEFWFLAWMVAIVQGGSQALSRSLYASMSPAAKSGEFFGLYGIMEKFSSILGPLLFAGAVATFGSSRPAIVSLVAFFIVGGYLLTRVNIVEGQRVAREEDAALIPRSAAQDS